MKLLQLADIGFVFSRSLFMVGIVFDQCVSRVSSDLIPFLCRAMHGDLLPFLYLSGEMLWLDPFAQLVDRGVITVFFSCFEQLVERAVPVSKFIGLL